MDFFSGDAIGFQERFGATFIQEVLGIDVNDRKDPNDTGTVNESDVIATILSFSSSRLEGEFHSGTTYAVIALFYETAELHSPNPSSLTYCWFGFSSLPAVDHPVLLGLYQSLILRLNCRIHEFERAFREGKLSVLIESKFSLIPNHKRGVFYKWFNERKQFFDGLQPILCDIHHGVYSLSGFAQETFPRRHPQAYHPGDGAVSLKDMCAELGKYFPDEDHPYDCGLHMSEIAVTALFYETLMSQSTTLCSLTYHCFGFSKLHHVDQQVLANMYRTVISNLKCSKRLFLEAFERGRLYNLIEEQYSKGPQRLRRGCYEEWFVYRKALFDSLEPLSREPEYPPSRLATAAWPSWNSKTKDLREADVHVRLWYYLTEEEKNTLRFTDMTEGKVVVVSLLYEAVMDERDEFEKSPVLSLSDNSEGWNEMEYELRQLYRTLIICLGCKVDEFLQAYEERQLAELIESKFYQLPSAERGSVYKKLFPRFRKYFNGYPTELPLSVISGLRTMFGSTDGSTSVTGTDAQHFPYSQIAPMELYQLVAIGLPMPHMISYKLFGFGKVDEENQQFLLGLYRELKVNFRTPFHLFVIAFIKGALSRLFNFKYAKVQENRPQRSMYYRWFMKHRPLFDEIKPPTSTTTDLEERLKGVAIAEDDSTSSTVEEKRECRVCSKTSSSKCSKCLKVWYCSTEHQTKDWKKHRNRCRIIQQK